MSYGSARWLLDSGFPRASFSEIDVVHVDDRYRVPGPAGLSEARAMGRTLVTCNQEFLGPCDLRIEHDGIVILDGMPVDGPEIERNLLHLIFRLSQHAGAPGLFDNRFLLSPDRAVFQILPTGAAVDLESWKTVRTKNLLVAVG
jgi:hypothetical protein